ncbi:hypothetical protein FIBSPDRAFT_856201 [Athelia psychrophila]|uniref:TFIIS N-terminal domain-containing protein n=1 Tax=Athelia psychrophila TaxID=1759441 RepID=A0A166NNX0_9AGAM|nr:hypothetical protein FIBSPDRAFT_856201 [Fibularhizoctonia sp. CBS 109695]
MASNPNLERDIFGGSDSELSSDEDDRRDARPAAPTRRQAPQEDEDVSSGEEYVQQARTHREGKKQRKPKGDGEKGTSRKRKRPPRAQFNEQELDEMAPEDARKAKLDMQIEAILKPKKANKSKKKRKDDEEVLDRFADEEVARLRESMLAAAADDDQANREKLPATSKLRLLPSVMEILRKASLSQSIIDNNLLEGVRRWLEPLPDRSLPALNIQRDFFPILKRMEFIDSSVLKESGLGRIILFYIKCKRVTADIRRTADELVSIWSRPIIKRSASYRDRVVPTALDAVDGERGQERLNAIMARAKEAEKGRVRKNAVMIPQREMGSYTVAPKVSGGIMKTNASVDVDIQRRRNNAERLRMLTRKVTQKN